MLTENTFEHLQIMSRSVFVVVVVGLFTKDVKDVAVSDRSIFVLHNASVVSSVWRHNTFHHQAPVLMPQLESRKHPQNMFRISNIK